jgi:hypothetical protein
MWTQPPTRKLNRSKKMCDTPKLNEAADGGLRLTTCSRSSEIRRLRALFPEILRNLESGDCVADCSLEFLEQIPNEVKLVTRRHKRELSEAWHLLNVLSLNLMDDGPTWPRALEWLRRNKQFRPENVLAHPRGQEEPEKQTGCFPASDAASCSVSSCSVDGRGK